MSYESSLFVVERSELPNVSCNIVGGYELFDANVDESVFNKPLGCPLYLNGAEVIEDCHGKELKYCSLDEAIRELKRLECAYGDYAEFTLCKEALIVMSKYIVHWYDEKTKLVVVHYKH